MALGLTGATGAYAPSTATIKTAANMASVPIDGNQYVAYHFTSADNQVCTMRQASAADGTQATVLELVAGGQQGSVLVRLSVQNAIDLAAAFVSFANGQLA